MGTFILAFIDDTEVQKMFENKIEEYIVTYCSKDYNHNQVVWYTNGFKKGYENGVNVPIKKLYCGKEDGIKFANNEVKDRFGKNILFTKDTRTMIYNFVNQYLNDINHIPQEYMGMLYKRWYCDSFKLGVKTTLAPKIPVGPEDTSVADCNNALRHILSRLIEFLFISVYRETTFREIFNNADPDVFLEAVGIKKEDFDALNKYHIFEEKTLNNYIHEFFVNESIGSTLNLDDPRVKEQYRNSFDWFGYGVDHDSVKQEVKEYIDAFENQELTDKIVQYDEECANREEEKTLDETVLEEPSIESNDELTSITINVVPEEDIKESNVSDLDRVIEYLKVKSKPVKAKELSSALNMSKHDVNELLFNNRDKFLKDFFGGWMLK